MKASSGGKQILFVTLSKREVGPLLSQLRAAGHLVSLVEEIEAAKALLASRGFDQAVLPAAVLQSLLEQRPRWEATDTEAWRRSTAGIAHDLQALLKALECSIEELQGQRGTPLGVASLDEISRRISVLSAFLYEVVLELSNGTSEELNLTDFDLEDAVEAAAVTFYLTASEKQQRLVIDIAAEVARIRADRIKLKRVLTNLLGYAIRQTPPRGTVTVRASQEESHCVIAVSDTGEGIRQSELRRLFNPVREPQGAAGPGLAQVKRLVEQHGGRVWVESQKGAGTTVFISLPQPAGFHHEDFRQRAG